MIEIIFLIAFGLIVSGGIYLFVMLGLLMRQRDKLRKEYYNFLRNQSEGSK